MFSSVNFAFIVKVNPCWVVKVFNFEGPGCKHLLGWLLQCDMTDFRNEFGKFATILNMLLKQHTFHKTKVATQKTIYQNVLSGVEDMQAS